MGSALLTKNELLIVGGLFGLAATGLLAWGSDDAETTALELLAGVGVIALLAGVLFLAFRKRHLVRRFANERSFWRFLLGVSIAAGVMAVVLLICSYTLDEDDAAEAADWVGGLVGVCAGSGLLYALFYFQRRALYIYLLINIGLVLLGGFAWLWAVVGAGWGVFGDVILVMLNGWAVYAFLRYRHSRQDELVQVIAAAVAGGVPLASALWSTIADRPRPKWWREALVAPVYILLPLYLYVRMCIGWRRYDRLVADVAERLDAGEPLSAALRAVPGVADREACLAVTLGEETGTLAQSLRDVRQERWSTAWLEVAPRLIYPPALFLIAAGITTFLAIAIVPKLKRIFDDFHQELPAATRAILDVYAWADDNIALVAMAKSLPVVMIALLVANPTVRWHTPLLGRLYRAAARATVLRTLGRVLVAGKTVPEALAFLGRSCDLPPVVTRRAAAAQAAVERGESFAAALDAAGLLPPNMAPLVRAAQRSGTLPWALGELGDHLAGRAVRSLRRASLIVAPVMLLAVAAVIATVVIGLFLPLVQLILGLSE